MVQVVKQAEVVREPETVASKQVARSFGGGNNHPVDGQQKVDRDDKEKAHDEHI